VTNWGKLFLLGTAVSIVAVGCTGTDAARNAGSPQNVGAQAPEKAAPSAATDRAPDVSVVVRIVAAAKSAESQPHGGIGEPATAKSP